jgi:hypothetical protein
MKLFAISDLHIGFAANRRAVAAMRPHPDDWLAVSGDVADTEADFASALDLLVPKFRQVLWVPGNHELWTMPDEPTALRGVRKYERLVQLCRTRGVLTPADPYPVWPGPPPPNSPEGVPYIVAPLFVLYDYSFRPSHVADDEAVQWAEDSGVLCTDEALLWPDPYPSRPAWCAALCDEAERRLAALPADARTILVNHFPLLEEDVFLPRIPRFSIWCGTRRTSDWHRRFRASVVVYGHLHIRTTRLRDGVRFEEVSLGYPRQWSAERRIESYLREILPGP